MGEFVIRVGSCTAQGRRSNNEDRFVADIQRHVFLVADGMGGQDRGEEASGLAAAIIPPEVSHRLAAREDVSLAVRGAIEKAHRAIVEAGLRIPTAKRMGTTAVLAVHSNDQVVVGSVGDSPAFLIRGNKVQKLTVDHTIADALARNGTITEDQAKSSPWRNVLYRFLGCAEMTDSADVYPFRPQAGDRLVLASDGLSGYVTSEDFIAGCCRHPQEWANYLVHLALERGSNDNVTCVVVAFDTQREP
ncbi:MAG: serine/threonine-protein phosphatase [Planctomycetia bacterium]|nr:serine/threonine-protein phosphatase [Planctomycetia bacterium]